MCKPSFARERKAADLGESGRGGGGGDKINGMDGSQNVENNNVSTINVFLLIYLVEDLKIYSTEIFPHFISNLKDV